MSDLDRWHLSDRGHQEVHEDVFTVRQLVNHSLQAGRQVVSEQVVIIPEVGKDDQSNPSTLTLGFGLFLKTNI